MEKTIDYKTKLFNEISRIETVMKREASERSYEYGGITYNLAERGERMALIHSIADEYIAAHAEFNHKRVLLWQRKKDETGKGGEYPPAPVSVDTALLDRLADAVLAEELKDKHADKITRNEYPFMSVWQLELRRDNEVSDNGAATKGSDGKDHRMPTRRKRNSYEQNRIDRRAKIRNEERRKQYRKDTVPGPVISYTANPDDIALYLEEKYGSKLAIV